MPLGLGEAEASGLVGLLELAAGRDRLVKSVATWMMLERVMG